MVLFHLDPGRSQKGSCDPPASLEYYFRALTLKIPGPMFSLCLQHCKPRRKKEMEGGGLYQA